MLVFVERRRVASSRNGRPHLSSLLWRALGGLEGAHVTYGAGHGGMPALREWANTLRALDADGIATALLPERLRLSKRAVRSGIALAVRRGWASERRAADGRAIVYLTHAGSEVAQRWETVRADAESVWQASIGSAGMQTLRSSLEELVRTLPLELSHYPARYGAADERITGGNGTDWRAVSREHGDTVSMLALSALISQAVVAFAMAARVAMRTTNASARSSASGA